MNLARNQDRLTLSNFESPSYCWLTYDLAAPIYSLFVYARLQQMEYAVGKTLHFLSSSVRGYLRKNVLSIEAMECLPAFIT